jgi:hypothetical protein
LAATRERPAFSETTETASARSGFCLYYTRFGEDEKSRRARLRSLFRLFSPSSDFIAQNRQDG